MRYAASRRVMAAFLIACAAPCIAAAQSTDIAGRVAKLEQSLNNRGLLDLLREVEALRRDVQNLRGELENQAYTLDQLKKSQTAGYTDLDSRLRGMSGGTVVGSDPNGVTPLPTLQAAPADAVAGDLAAQGNLQVQPARGVDVNGNSTAELPNENVPPGGSLDPSTGLAIAAPPAGEMPPRAPVSTPDAPLAPLPPPTPSIDDATSEAAYRDAFGALKAGEYDQAIVAFNAFQHDHPNSQYGDNAQFWLAEAHYVKRDFAAALPEYQKMLVAYPASKKLSHAMLKIGYCYSELGKPAEARAVLDDLQQRYAGSAAAQLAAQRISQLPPSP